MSGTTDAERARVDTAASLAGRTRGRKLSDRLSGRDRQTEPLAHEYATRAAERTCDGAEGSVPIVNIGLTAAESTTIDRLVRMWLGVQS